MVLQPIMHGLLSLLLAAPQQFKQKESQFIVWKMSIFCNLFVWKMSIFCNLFVWKMSIFDVLFVWIILFQLSL